MMLPDVTAFLNSLSACNEQILIASPTLAYFSRQRRTAPDCITDPCVLFASAANSSRSHHRPLRTFRVSDDQLLIASPDLRAFHACNGQILITSLNFACSLTFMVSSASLDVSPIRMTPTRRFLSNVYFSYCLRRRSVVSTVL